MSNRSGNLSVWDKFGPAGKILRRELPELISACHSDMVNAQHVSGVKCALVYGCVWIRVMEEIVERFKDLPGAEVIQYENYKLLAINGIIVFPWRYGKDATCNIESCDFNSTDSQLRHLLFAKKDNVDQLHLELCLGVPKRLRNIAGKYGVVIVGYASDTSALYNVEWGEVISISEKGFLNFSSKERLFDKNVSGVGLIDTSVVDGEAFDAGPIPHLQLEVQDDLSKEDNG